MQAALAALAAKDSALAAQQTALAARERELAEERRLRSVAEDDRCCVVCQELPKCIVLLPCSHVCLCERCGLLEAVSLCPLCRGPVSGRVRVFL